MSYFSGCLRKLHPLCGYNAGFGLQYLTAINMMMILGITIIEAKVMYDITADEVNYRFDMEMDLTSEETVGITIIAFHILLNGAQGFLSYQLRKGAKQREYQRCKNCYKILFVLIGLEVILLVFFSTTGLKFHLYVTFMTILILYRIFLIWPINFFLQEIQYNSEPLVFERATLHF